VGRGFVPGSETQQGLECSHRLLPTIMAKDEFIKVSLDPIAAYAVMGKHAGARFALEPRAFAELVVTAHAMSVTVRRSNGA
jgi:hypothetical protein